MGNSESSPLHSRITIAEKLAAVSPGVLCAVLMLLLDPRRDALDGSQPQGSFPELAQQKYTEHFLRCDSSRRSALVRYPLVRCPSLMR